MPELKMKYNEATDEVEVLVDNEVLIASGAPEFKSWVDYYNEKHKPVVVESPVEEKQVVVTDAPAEPAPAPEVTVQLDTPAEPVVD